MDEFEQLYQALLAAGFSPQEAMQVLTPPVDQGRGSLGSMLANRQAGTNFVDIPGGNSGQFFDPIEAERMRHILGGQPSTPVVPDTSIAGGDPGFSGMMNTGAMGDGPQIFPPVGPGINPMGQVFPNAATTGIPPTGSNQFFEDGSVGESQGMARLLANMGKQTAAKSLPAQAAAPAQQNAFGNNPRAQKERSVAKPKPKASPQSRVPRGGKSPKTQVQVGRRNVY